MLYWLLAAPLTVLVFLYVLILIRLGTGTYALDPQDAGTGKSKGRGTFEPHNRNYMELAKLVIGLGSASIAALAIFFFKADDAVHGLRRYIASPLIFFAATVVYGVAFIGLLVWRYEKYCHDSNSYTSRWYALVAALGASMMVSLALGYAVFVGILLHFLNS